MWLQHSHLLRYILSSHAKGRRHDDLQIVLPVEHLPIILVMPSLTNPYAEPFAFFRQPLVGRRSHHPARGALLPPRLYGSALRPVHSTFPVLRQSGQNPHRRHLLVKAFSFSTQQSQCTSDTQELRMELADIYKTYKTWQWRGHAINYSQSGHGEGSSLLLVHGFGASVGHWRRNIKVLAENYNVFAIDLLGFGASDKPAYFAYEMEIWAQLILDFLEEVVRKPTVLIGNSVGSLACVIAVSESRQGLVRGLVLLNCAGGMNNKAIVDDWRIKLLLPFLLLFDFLLRQRWIASMLFERVKRRENLKSILLSVYGNKDSVDDELVEIIKGPADDEGALDAFVSIVTGPPGPNPISLMTNIRLPVLVLWGDQDPFTPLDGPIGKSFLSLSLQLPNVNIFVLEGVGHCPHDDRPHLVHEKLLPWLATLPKS